MVALPSVAKEEEATGGRPAMPVVRKRASLTALVPWLAGGDAIEPDMRRALAACLFAPDATLLVGFLALAFTAMLTSLRLRSAWPLCWLAIAIPLNVYRFTLDRHFRAAPAFMAPEAWARRFAWGAWGTALLWGAAALEVPIYDDGFSNMVIISVQASFIAVSAARNNASPAVAIGQVCITELFALAACLGSGDHFMAAFGLLTTLYMASSLGTVRILSRRMLRMLRAEQDQARLLADLNLANRGLAAVNDRLAALSTTDELTALANRRGFDNHLAAEWRRAARDGTELALVMIDVDRFKAYNDTYGHVAGDDCLRQVAAIMAAAVRRPGDMAFRYGGEEFALLLPNLGVAGAETAADIVRRAVDAANLPHAGSELRRVTISLGCASIRPAAGRSSAVLLRLADSALYESKRLGRNRVHAHAPQSDALSDVAV